MAKTKASVTLDPTKVARARELLGSTTLSELIEVALDRLIVGELERRHAEGYVLHPSQPDEEDWAEVARDPGEVADEVDWALLYGVSESQ